MRHSSRVTLVSFASKALMVCAVKHVPYLDTQNGWIPEGTVTGIFHPSASSAMFTGAERAVARHAIVDAARPSPIEWMRGRRAEREQRRVDAAHQKAVEHLDG